MSKQHNWNEKTVVKDTVHGYINIPKPISKEIIDTPLFQRLHGIAQTGMEVLYPNATHNRFCHAIGVYYLGVISFRSFQDNIASQYHDAIYKIAVERSFTTGSCGGKTPLGAGDIWKKWELLFHIACLLHDCGHSPYSHSLEHIYDFPDKQSAVGSDAENNVKLNRELLLCFRSDDSNFESDFIGGRVCGQPHERMSALLITQKDGCYGDNIIRLLKSYMQKVVLFERGEAYTEWEKCYEDNNGSRDDLEFIARMIIGCKYTRKDTGNSDKDREVWHSNQIRNCIIELLNSKLDVDNLDYSIRDASVSGYKSTQVDFERLLKAKTVVPAYRVEEFPAEYLLRKGEFDYFIQLARFDSDGEDQDVVVTGSCTVRKTGEHGTVSLVGSDDPDQNSMGRAIKVHHNDAGETIRLRVRDGAIITIVPRRMDSRDGRQAPLYIKGSLSGSLSGIVINGHIDGKAPPDTEFLLYPAFHKSALSVIQGAFSARNFEHLWIYSHHITTYHNNFLIPCLLEKYADYLCCQEHDSFCEALQGLLELMGPKNLVPGSVSAGTLSSASPFENVMLDIENLLSGDKNYKVNYPNPDIAWECEPQAVDICNDLKIVIKNTKDVVITSISRETRYDAYSVIINAITRIYSEGIGAEALESIQMFLEKHTVLTKMKTNLPIMLNILGMPDEQSVMGEHFKHTDDADLTSRYKKAVHEITSSGRKDFELFIDIVGQLSSRRYLTAAWKSHAEFNFYFRHWSAEAIAEAIKLFSPVNIPNSNAQYLVFPPSIRDEYKSDKEEFWKAARDMFSLERLVIVMQTIKSNAFEGEEPLIVWKQRVLTLRDMKIDLPKKEKTKFFYVYFKHCDEIDTDKCSLSDSNNVSRFVALLKQYVLLKKGGESLGS